MLQSLLPDKVQSHLLPTSTPATLRVAASQDGRNSLLNGFPAHPPAPSQGILYLYPEGL